MNNTPSILQKIIARKQQEVAQAKSQVSVQELERMPGFFRKCYVFKDALTDPSKNGIVAEFKRQSPSKGLINGTAAVSEVVSAYAQAGVSAISVLTDTSFFGGKAEDLMKARETVSIPLLRKDFIMDEYQLLEAKAWGADIVLLIAAMLTPEQIRNLAGTAKNLGLNVLLEVHNRQELESSICPNLDAVGVNNRNLNNFTVDIETSFDLVHLIPDDLMKISESAISDTATIKLLKAAGFNGFLIGENFMKSGDPRQAVQDFVKAL